MFRTPDPFGAGGPDGLRTVVKAVVGGSHQFAVGSGRLVHPEYHYSGFGARSRADILPLLATLVSYE